MTRGNGADLAKMLRVRPGAITAAEKTGRIKRGKDGLFDLEESAKQFVDGRRKKPGPGRKRRDIKDESSAPLKPSGEDDVVADDDPQTLVHWQTRVAREQFLKRRLERRQLEGSLIRRDAVAREAAEFSVLVRDRLRNIPMRLRDRLAAETSPRVCGDLVAAEIDKALNVLADG